MISKRNDYSFLLDDLKETAEKYYVNDYGRVVDIDDKLVDDERIILNTKFYTLYCMAYKHLVEAIDNYPIDDAMDEGFVKRALSDDNVFNSFINNCVSEYKIYNSVGTGYIMYFPYNLVSDFFFENMIRTRLLTQYLNNELADFLNNDKVKIRVKK